MTSQDALGLVTIGLFLIVSVVLLSMIWKWRKRSEYYYDRFLTVLEDQEPLPQLPTQPETKYSYEMRFTVGHISSPNDDSKLRIVQFKDGVIYPLPRGMYLKQVYGSSGLTVEMSSVTSGDRVRISSTISYWLDDYSFIVKEMFEAQDLYWGNIERDLEFFKGYDNRNALVKVANRS